MAQILPPQALAKPKMQAAINTNKYKNFMILRSKYFAGLLSQTDEDFKFTSCFYMNRKKSTEIKAKVDWVTGRTKILLKLKEN